MIRWVKPKRQLSPGREADETKRADRDSPTCQAEQPRQGPGWQGPGCCPGAPLPTPTQWPPRLTNNSAPPFVPTPSPKVTLPNSRFFLVVSESFSILKAVICSHDRTAASPALVNASTELGRLGSGKPSPPLPPGASRTHPALFGSRGSTPHWPSQSHGRDQLWGHSCPCRSVPPSTYTGLVS